MGKRITIENKGATLEESVQLEISKFNHNSFAKFLATYMHYRNVKGLAIRGLLHFQFENAEWQLSLDHTGDVLTIKCFPSQAEQSVVYGEGRRIGAVIERQDAIINAVKSESDRLEEAVSIVNGKKEFLEKLDPEKEADLYKQTQDEIAAMEKELGAYEPFRVQYLKQIEDAEKIKEDCQKELDALPKIDEPKEWEFNLKKLKV